MTIDTDRPDTWPEDAIAQILRNVTDQQLRSEVGRRSSVMRKVRTGGRNGGRPRKINPDSVTEPVSSAIRP